MVKRFLNADVFTSTGQGFLGYNMFAYCKNSPIGLIDSSGQSPFTPFLNILDYWCIHRMVQDECFVDYGWLEEVSVNGTQGYGRLDLYDYQQNSYYEVKSEGAAKLRSTERQMEKYDQSTPSWFPNNGTPSRGTQQVSGSFQYGFYDVSYRRIEPGLIQYTPTFNYGRATFSTLATAFSLVAIGAACYFTGGLAALAFL